MMNVEKPKIALFLCECSTNISNFIDLPVVADWAKGTEDFCFIEVCNLLCSPDGKKFFAEKLKEHKPDGIMHFASHTLVGESVQKPFLYLRDNVVNGLNLLESAVKHGVKAFILSSTANLFDDPEQIPIAETERIVPGSPYGESKHILERYLHWMDGVYGMKYACLRYFNACGATTERGEHHAPETHQHHPLHTPVSSVPIPHFQYPVPLRSQEPSFRSFPTTSPLRT